MLFIFAPITPNNFIYIVHILLIFLFTRLFYGHIMYIPQLTSNISSLLFQFFSPVDLITSNSHTHIGTLVLQLCYSFNNVSLLLVLNVHHTVPYTVFTRVTCALFFYFGR
jgi:hypothetical protein